MGGAKTIGLILIVLGIIGLAIGGFSFTKETHDAKIGPVEIALKEKEHVNIPVWAGVAAVIAGGVLLATGKK